MPPDRLDALIKHPFHRENAERLIGFIRDLRECHCPEDFVAFQHELLKAMLEASHARAARNRVIKRLKRGEKLPRTRPSW